MQAETGIGLMLRIGALATAAAGLARAGWQRQVHCASGSVPSCRSAVPPVAIVLDLDADGVVGRPCAETIYTAVYNGTLGVKLVSVCACVGPAGALAPHATPAPVRLCRTSPTAPTP